MNPLVAFARSILLNIAGRINFPRVREGKEHITGDGRSLKVVQQGRLQVDAPEPGPGVVLWMHFHIGQRPESLSRAFAWVPLPVIAGLPGFRSSTWTLDEKNGEVEGLAEWDTVAQAEAFTRSVMMRLVTLALDPQRVMWNIIARGDH